MYYVVFTLCALYDARSLSIPRWLLLVLCLAACLSVQADDRTAPPAGVADAVPPSITAPATYRALSARRALSGLLLALPVYRLVAHNRCGIGDSAGACALGGRYGVTMGAFAVTAGLMFLLGAVSTQGTEPRPTLSPARYPLFPALLAGDLTVFATTRLLTTGGGL